MPARVLTSETRLIITKESPSGGGKRVGGGNVKSRIGLEKGGEGGDQKCQIRGSKHVNWVLLSCNPSK